MWTINDVDQAREASTGGHRHGIFTDRPQDFGSVGSRRAFAHATDTTAGVAHATPAPSFIKREGLRLARAARSGDAASDSSRAISQRP